MLFFDGVRVSRVVIEQIRTCLENVLAIKFLPHHREMGETCYHLNEATMAHILTLLRGIVVLHSVVPMKSDRNNCIKNKTRELLSQPSTSAP